MKFSKFWFAFVVLVIVVVSGQPVFAASHLAAVHKGNPAHTIPNRYIIVFKDTAPDQVVDAALVNAMSEISVVEHFRYKSAMKGFAATLNDKALELLRQNPNVDYVEEDQEIRIDTTQSSPGWGLDRLDQHKLPLSSTFHYSKTGKGVTAYIIDTGIYISHSDFGGRAVVGVDAVGDGQKGIDCNGHGTHVAGIVGGKVYGVAKAVKLVAVRVLDCFGSGTVSSVMAGIDWVTEHKKGPSVANMSLGGSISTALDAAVQNSIKHGVVFAIAAGNNGGMPATHPRPGLSLRSRWGQPITRTPGHSGRITAPAWIFLLQESRLRPIGWAANPRRIPSAAPQWQPRM
jgi:aqualysin 1